MKSNLTLALTLTLATSACVTSPINGFSRYWTATPQPRYTLDQYNALHPHPYQRAPYIYESRPCCNGCGDNSDTRDVDTSHRHMGADPGHDDQRDGYYNEALGAYGRD